MAKTPLPAGWTDEYKGYESLYDPSVAGHWQHTSGAAVTRWKDDLSCTWGFKATGGTVPTIGEAFVQAEVAATRFATKKAAAEAPQPAPLFEAIAIIFVEV